jgi:hypothetical protein
MRQRWRMNSILNIFCVNFFHSDNLKGTYANKVKALWPFIKLFTGIFYVLDYSKYLVHK